MKSKFTIRLALAAVALTACLVRAETNPFIPFLAVTGRPTAEDIARKVAALKADGFDQFLVYARSGLQYRYMGEEWLVSVERFCEEADRHGMKVWLYDEYNWPSGTCKGRVPNEDPRYRYSEWAVYARPGGGYEWKVALAPPGWVDVCSDDAMKRFVELTHEVYEKRLAKWLAKKTVVGIFTDEPGHPTAIHFEGRPTRHFCRWEGLEAEYAAATGRDFRADVEASLSGKGSDEVWETYAALHGKRFRRVYFDRIAAWCRKVGLESTGHMIAENEIVGSCRYNGNPLLALKGETIPGMDEINSRSGTGRQTPEWLTLAVVQHAATRNRNGGLVELYALGPNDMSPARLRQMFWLEAAYGVNRYLVSMQVMDHRGLVEKHGYLSPIQEGQPWHGELAGLFAEAKKAAQFARKPGCRMAAAVRYPQKAAARATYAGGKRPRLCELLGAMAVRQLAVDLVDEDEPTDQPFVFEVRADGSFRETRTGTDFADPALAAAWLRDRTKANVRYFDTKGNPATDLIVREYADGSSLALDVHSQGDRVLDAVIGGVKRRCRLPARGVFALSPGELPPEDVVREAKGRLEGPFAYALDRDNVMRVNFTTNRVGCFVVDERLEGVRLVLRECAIAYAVTDSGRPVDELEKAPPGEKVFRHAAERYSFRLDGREIAGERTATSLPVEYNPLYRETASFTLEPGEHRIELVTGESDRNYFLPAAFVAGRFANRGGKLGRLPERLRFGTLAEQGLGDFCGKLTYFVDGAAVGGKELTLATGGLYTNVRWNGRDLGTKGWTPFVWQVPEGAAGRLEISVFTPVVNICGSAQWPGADWDIRMWLSPRDPEYAAGLQSVEIR